MNIFTIVWFVYSYYSLHYSLFQALNLAQKIRHDVPHDGLPSPVSFQVQLSSLASRKALFALSLGLLDRLASSGDFQGLSLLIFGQVCPFFSFAEDLLRKLLLFERHLRVFAWSFCRPFAARFSRVMALVFGSLELFCIFVLSPELVFLSGLERLV